MNLNESYILDDEFRKRVDCYDNYLKEQEASTATTANKADSGLTDQQANNKLSRTLEVLLKIL